jgi:4-hydroxy-tetrahydrodipicolinate reductase
MQRVCIAGASGRMGRALIEAAHASAVHTVAAALDLPGSYSIGRDAGGPRGAIEITDDIRDALSASDVLIDFTRPEGTLAHLEQCMALGVRAVIGTTGFDPAGLAAIRKASKKIAIVLAPNFSVGVNVALKLVEQAARSLGADYDIEVFEAHHKLKVDAPSGTAIGMGQAAAAGRGLDLDEVATWTRHGVTGERKAGTIGFSSVRGGDIIGDHTVYFAGPGERIEITHRSNSRANYAQGALRAALWLANKPHGLFDMQDVLALR